MFVRFQSYLQRFISQKSHDTRSSHTSAFLHSDATLFSGFHIGTIAIGVSMDRRLGVPQRRGLMEGEPSANCEGPLSGVS
jgi:hypothetical protein